jgi:hypothetical protein
MSVTGRQTNIGNPTDPIFRLLFQEKGHFAMSKARGWIEK